MTSTTTPTSWSSLPGGGEGQGSGARPEVRAGVRKGEGRGLEQVALTVIRRGAEEMLDHRDAVVVGIVLSGGDARDELGAG